MTQQKRLFTIYLPLSDCDGEPLPMTQLLWVRGRIAAFARGYTVLGPSDGFWVSATGYVHRDSVLPIQVVAPATADSDRFFAGLARELATLLGQHQIFIHAAPVALFDIDDGSREQGTENREQGRFLLPLQKRDGRRLG